jgi:hypothetical protein
MPPTGIPRPKAHGLLTDKCERDDSLSRGWIVGTCVMRTMTLGTVRGEGGWWVHVL